MTGHYIRCEANLLKVIRYSPFLVDKFQVIKKLWNYFGVKKTFFKQVGSLVRIIKPYNPL